jgi:hypothetical protein
MGMIVMLSFVLNGFGGPEIVTLAQGQMSKVQAPETIVVRAETDWSELWRTHVGDGARPDVDFSRRIVVGVFAGSRPTAGYRIAIAGTSKDGDTLVVEYVEHRPAPDMMVAQVQTSPFHLAAVPAHPGPVRFRALERDVSARRLP